MIFVACAGFPVATSRYFREFMAVEINQTELGIPGGGTVRRWQRECPEGFGFSVLAPGTLSKAGFSVDKTNTETVKTIAQLARTLAAVAVVYRAGDEFAASKPNRTKLRRFALALPRLMGTRGPRPVLDLQAWSVQDVLATIKDAPVSVAVDPLTDQLDHSGTPAGRLSNTVLYLRLPGPSGYRSRYTDDHVDRAMAYARASKAKKVFVVFRNIDMYVNAQRGMSALSSG